jgi:hypothetical protein
MLTQHDYSPNIKITKRILRVRTMKIRTLKVENENIRSQKFVKGSEHQKSPASVSLRLD